MRSNGPRSQDTAMALCGQGPPEPAPPLPGEVRVPRTQHAKSSYPLVWLEGRPLPPSLRPSGRPSVLPSSLPAPPPFIPLHLIPWSMGIHSAAAI